MDKINLTLETITPIFLSGNDQNAVEFRAASIRGQLRYWYRALLGGLGITQPNLLHQMESHLFGKEDQGSRVLVRLKDTHLAGGRVKQNRELDLGYDKAKKITRHPGLTYLLYSTQLGGNERPYADVGTTFTLDLCCFEGHPQKWLKLTACALWCWCHFGGLGTRSRRGGGNIQVKEIVDNKKLLGGLHGFKLDGVNDWMALKEHIENGLRNVCTFVGELNALTPKPLSGRIDFPVLNPKYTDVWIVKETWSDIFVAMEQVGKKFQWFRSKRNPDFPSVWQDYLSKGNVPDLERTAFGLPLQFRYRSAPDKQAMVETEHFTRRASPLLFRFLRLDSGKIALVLIHFKSSFLPGSEKLKIRDQSRGAKRKPEFPIAPTNTIQQNLIEGFRAQFSGYLEVRGWL